MPRFRIFPNLRPQTSRLSPQVSPSFAHIPIEESRHQNPGAPLLRDQNLGDRSESRMNKHKKKALERHKKRQVSLDFSHIPIEDQVILMFPGQGTQHLKMGEKLLDHPKCSSLFDEASEILGYNILDVCMNGPKTKLDQTIYTQPAVFVCSMAALEKMRAEQPDLQDRLTYAAGFSIGEFCALVAADMLSFADALKLVKVRAEAMHECSQRVPSGMLTIRVCAASELEKALKEAANAAWEEGDRPAVCEIANYLYCGVKVLGGTQTALKYIEENASRFKFQVIKRLPVSGAFHTKIMEPAATEIARCIKDDIAPLRTPRINVYSNYTGKPFLRRPQDIQKAIVNQVHSPVLWEQIMQKLYRTHQDLKFPSYFEVGPGRQLGAILLQVSKKAYAHYVNYPC